ncbi:hypothetical protein CCACVL1_17516, partial [Corchorus capsularis]
MEISLNFRASLYLLTEGTKKAVTNKSKKEENRTKMTTSIRGGGDSYLWRKGIHWRGEYILGSFNHLADSPLNSHCSFFRSKGFFLSEICTTFHRILAHLHPLKNTIPP